MKCIIISSLALLLFSSPIMAQKDYSDLREDMTFGLKAGINYANVWDEKGQDFQADPRVGFAGGLFASIPINKYLGIQPEALISQKGYEGSGTILGSRYTSSRTTTYLDIPLQLQFKPSEFITLVAGPQYSYLLKQKDKYTFGPNSTEQEQEFDNDNIRDNTLGFVAGVDLMMKQVVFSARAGWDLQNNHGDGNSSTPRYKNQWLQFTLGFVI
ncbi:MAG: porin family protein [Vicingaceae bacterium]